MARGWELGRRARTLPALGEQLRAVRIQYAVQFLAKMVSKVRSRKLHDWRTTYSVLQPGKMLAQAAQIRKPLAKVLTLPDSTDEPDTTKLVPNR